MYYNKAQVSRQLEEGVCDPAGIVEDLEEFINEIFRTIRERQLDVELQDLIDKWEDQYDNINCFCQI